MQTAAHPLHPCLLPLLCVALTAAAQELKVDINNHNRPVSEGNDPAYTSWNSTSAWFPGGDTIVNTFNGITVRFTRVGSAGTALEPNYWKEGVQSTTYDLRLTADGIRVNSGTAGARIEMRISGLPAGEHTLLTYHNCWDNSASVAPLDVSVNGNLVIDNLPVTVRVTNNAAATTAYVTFTAVMGQDVVILFAAETSGAQANKNVYINAFEINTPNVKAQANQPVPNNADEHVDADSGPVTLRWSPAVSGLAVSHDVYFGTSSNAVRQATRASPEFQGNQPHTTFLVTNLYSLLTYYWRIDEVDATNGVTKGTLWYFRPRQLAFPGAEGYGRFARGGRGGVVVKVTNLNDSGPGSLRDAIEGNYGPRTVIFDVSGLITLQNDIIINENRGYITVAGQTAPGKGICIRRQQLAMSGAKDVILRFLRIFPGKESGETQNATGMVGVDHCIMDHCSVGWGIDEGLSTRGAKHLTFQRSMIAEMLNIAGHDDKPPGSAHGFAASIGGEIASFHHNLLVHNDGRNWSLAGGLDATGHFAGSLDIFNNVVYNWRNRTTDGGAHRVNFVNNYYKPGAATTLFRILTANYDNFPGTQQYYMVGNVMPGYFQTSQQESARTRVGFIPTNYPTWVDAPFFPSYATIDEVTNAYKRVLSDVGCNLPMVDNHDSRRIRETIDGTYTYTGTGPYGGYPGLPNSTDDVGGWDTYPTVSRPAHWDTDNDGMPDWWERIRGFNTNSAPGDFSESNSDLDGDGWTALEDYLNWMAGPNYECPAGGTVDIDLHALSRGFTNSGPGYTFSNGFGGTVTLVSNRFARFTPTVSVDAVGGFLFTVTDSQGYHMTRPVNLRIVGNGAAPTQPPAPPTGLNATAGNAQVTLTWNAAAEATSYTVKRATTVGGPYLPVATTATIAFTNTGLANGTTYYFVVSAVNLIGESPDSSPASATPQLPLPAAPAGLTATAGNTLVVLQWSASEGASDYIIKRATAVGGPYLPIATNSTTTFTNTGLVNGTAYFYVVSARNPAGESANSSPVTATPAESGGSALHAYEGFHYPPQTSIANQSGGSGWGATWGNITDAASALATNYPDGLTYGNGSVQLVTTGGKLMVGNPVGNTATTAQIQRQLPNTLSNLAIGGLVWISFLYHNPQTDKGGLAGFRETGLRLMSGATTNAAGFSNRNGTDRLAAGSPNTYLSSAGYDALSLFAAPTFVHNGYSTPRGPAASNVVFVVLRLDVDASTNADTARAWFFQNGNGLEGEPDPGAALVFHTADLSGVNALRFQAGNANASGPNAFWLLDEIRVGGSFTDVAPTTSQPPGPPQLDIRARDDGLWLELVGEPGHLLTVQTTTNLAVPWLDWTNLPGSGATQSVLLGPMTNQPVRFFRARAQ